MNVILIFIKQVLTESVSLWTAMAPYILLGLGMAGILNGFLGSSFITKHLGGHGIGAVLRASVFGVPLPVCSCGVIPLAASLNRQGAGKGATLSFLISTPTSGIDSILATYALMGPLFALFRPFAALAGGILVGGLYVLIHKKENEHTIPVISSDTHEKRNIFAMLRYGFIDLTADIGTWLIIGVTIGALLTVLIPQELMLKFLPTPSLHYLVMLVLGIPLYVCATGSIPIAAALIAKGFSPGSALVFLIAGPATNAVTLSFVRSKLGKMAFIIYLSSIGFIALMSGWLFDRVYDSDTVMEHLHHHGEAIPAWISVSAGIILFSLILLKWLLRPSISSSEIKLHDETWHVDGMNCKHCQTTVIQVLEPINGIKSLHFKLDKNILEIDGSPDSAQIEKALTEAGYGPERIR
ncbi:permease [bacterium]|nr:permease [bacterium]